MEKLTHGILEFGLSGKMKPLDPDYLTHLDQDSEENVAGNMDTSLKQDLGDYSSGSLQPSGEVDYTDLLGDYQSLLCGSLQGMQLDFNVSEIGMFPGGGSFNMSMCDGQSLQVTHDSGAFDALKEPHYMIPVVILYAVVILIGVLGNSMVFITVIRTKQMWNATNMFIANLAISDIFVCVFDLPLNLYSQITGTWIFGKTLCHVIPASFAVVVYDSTLTLTLISVDRFLLIVFPLRRRFSTKLALVLIGIISVISMAVASPIALFGNYFEWDDEQLGIHQRICSEKWPSAKSRLTYTVVTLICQYFVPLVVIGILYFLVFQRVRQRMGTQSKKKLRRTRTTKMLVAVVTVFAVAWTPFHLFSLIAEVNYDLVKGPHFKLMDALLKVVAMSSSCINPILYAWLNDNYRNAFLNLIKVGYFTAHLT